jgi:protein SCO1/2
VLGSEFAQLQDLLAGPLARGDLLLVSISFDPAHDTPAELTSYLERAQSRGAGWLATRPVDPDGLARLLRTFGITVIPDRFGGYTHNAAVHVIDPQGRLVAILDAGDPGHVAQTVLESLRS